MVTQEMCMGPLLCRTRTGECCQLEFFEGSVVCPLSCNINRQSQNPGGYSLNQIFGVTFVSTLFYNVFTNIGSTTATSTVPTITTTTIPPTTAPTFTTSMSKLSIWLISNNFISVTGISGTFSSVNYPNNYTNSYEEQFTISVKEGSTISLLFDFFDIEYHISCRYDNITSKLIIIIFV